MFSGFDPDMIPFFLDLRFHNEKRFMDANRQRYLEHVREPFYAFITELGQRMLPLLPDLEVRPAKCLSRINRDTRFSQDKSPYRDHLWAAYRRAGVGKDGMPFFWFEIAPEHLSWGAGIWGENREVMDLLRRRMMKDPDHFFFVLRQIREAGCVLSGPEWKKLPVPGELDPALASFYLKKAVYAEKLNTNLEWIYDPGIVDRVFQDYQKLIPFYQTLIGCIPGE